eukprot:scaffold87669_cov60-Phaeocystis_antarctica.AAC.4
MNCEGPGAATALARQPQFTTMMPVATILQVVSRRLDRLGFGSMSLKMAIVKHTSDTGGLSGLDHAASAPNLGCGNEVLT